jgi:hypothetical protein
MNSCINIACQPNLSPSPVVASGSIASGAIEGEGAGEQILDESGQIIKPESP